MSEDTMVRKVLCIDYAGDETISTEVCDTLRDAGFEVKRIPMSEVSKVGDGWSLVVQLGLSKKPELGRDFLEGLAKLFPQVPRLVLSGHRKNDEGIKVESLGGKYLTRTCSTVDLVNMAYKLAGAGPPKQKPAG